VLRFFPTGPAPLPIVALRWGLALFALWSLNFTLLASGIPTGSPLTFPISIYEGPALHLAGLLYALPFALAVVLALRLEPRLGAASLWGIALALLALGNLLQGDPDSAFLKPFYATYLGRAVQYFHDVRGISDPIDWLRRFNEGQTTLTLHSRTHPPFAVLLHWAVLRASGQNLAALAAAFMLIVSATPLVLWRALRDAGTDARTAGLVGLLLAVTPAFNIYGAASLDAVILALASLYLWGLVRASTRGIEPGAVLLMCVGLTAVNLLTFGGLFLVAVGVAFGVVEFAARRRTDLLVAQGVAIAVCAMALFAALAPFGYDHLRAFLTASRLENGSAQFLQRPLAYAMTRLEDIAEIVLFLGLVTAAVLSGPRREGGLRLGGADPLDRLSLVAAATLLLVFVTGAYRTGETARACLFIVPFLLLPLRRCAPERLRPLVIAAAVQTAVMQLTGGFFW